ncbi:MAG: Rieske (2Fe-2S) protein, partial [candidate division NC10 bacterium]|nr:Rieske (2Fe-2S) protein [candidate division NC10 bacterium]
MRTSRFVKVATIPDLERKGCMVLHVEGHTIALFLHQGSLYAIDNRCPHMGFPLDRGTLQDGVLTCHWHHARFDLASGGTFDPWADDVRSFPVRVEADEVWIDPSPRADEQARQLQRLRDGLQRNIRLVIAKSVIALVEKEENGHEPLRTGLSFGAGFRRDGWSMGLTILTCAANLLPSLNAHDRARALYHGLSAVAQDCDGQPPRVPMRPLPMMATGPDSLKRWFRRYIEVRDAEGAERCLVTALRNGGDPAQIADLLFASATDHRYLSTGHVLDFTNKALEALDIVGWQHAEAVLPSLVLNYATADRMEESNAWRHPVDLVAILHAAFDRLPDALEAGARRRAVWGGRTALIPVLLGEDPRAIADALLTALQEGATPQSLGAAVTYAAALRIARFHTANEFGDWDTVLHTFTFTNAVSQGLRRAPSAELARGLFDAAMSIYLDRFLNIPAARLPEGGLPPAEASRILDELVSTLDRRQQVDEAGLLVARYLVAGADAGPLLATLGHALFREDRDFHTIQAMEAAFRVHALTEDPAEKAQVLIAAVRYLAAHAPTPRAQGQTYQIAYR